MFHSIRVIFILTFLSLFSSSLVAAGLININKADAITLAENLNGIGDAKAKAIIAYRSENGDFAAIADLVNVKGIGSKLVERNRSLMTVGAEPQAASASESSVQPDTTQVAPAN